MKIYVAGASKERLMIADYMRRLREAGFEITHDWIAEMDQEKTPDNELSHEKAEKYGRRNLYGVLQADLFWLMIPENQSLGAWVELGYALARMGVIVSGDRTKSIFVHLSCDHFKTHEEAFEFIKS